MTITKELLHVEQHYLVQLTHHAVLHKMISNNTIKLKKLLSFFSVWIVQTVFYINCHILTKLHKSSYKFKIIDLATNFKSHVTKCRICHLIMPKSFLNIIQNIPLLLFWKFEKKTWAKIIITEKTNILGAKLLGPSNSALCFASNGSRKHYKI